MLTFAPGVQGVNGKVAAHAGVDGVAKAEHAPFSEQQMKGHTRNNDDADLAQDGETKVARKELRHDQEDCGKNNPNTPSIPNTRTAQSTHGFLPKSPLGLKINTKTKSKYGKMGAICVRVKLSTGL